MTKKNKLYIFIFFILIIFSVLLLLKVPCVFKTIFNIPCPGCGLSRAFKEIFKLHFLKALHYNILSIPLFIFFIYFFINIFKDIVKKEYNTFSKIDRLFSKYYILIIILIVISEIVNIYHGI